MILRLQFKSFRYCQQVSLNLKGSKIKDLERLIVDELISLKADVVTDQEREIKFYAGPIRLLARGGAGLNMLNSFNVGIINFKIEDESIQILYDLNFTTLLIVAAVLMILPTFFILRAPNLSIVESMIIIFGCYLYLTILNIFIGLIRFRRMINRVGNQCAYSGNEKIKK